jgi:hypothetical protein
MTKAKRLIDERHLDRIRQLSCLACGKKPSEAAHVRYASASYAKRITGIGTKPDDAWVVPLCPDCHRNGPENQHTGERKFWEKLGVDPLKTAQSLFVAGKVFADTDAVDAMEEIVRMAQKGS